MVSPIFLFKTIDFVKTSGKLFLVKIFKLQDINPMWLARRRFVCHLPTEMVIPCRYTNSFEIPALDCAYAYCLPRKEFLPVKESGKSDNGNSWTYFHDHYLVEIHENYGDDGHVEYTFMYKYVQVLESQLPKNFLEYRKLTDSVWQWEQEERNRFPRQLTLKDQKHMLYCYDNAWY